MESLSSEHAADWSVREADDYYGVRRWGAPHFSVDEAGYLCVHPLGNERSIRLHDIVREAIAKGIQPPLTIRIQDMLRARVTQLNEIFAQAIRDEGYGGAYRGVFPIKVNQLREVVEEIQDAGEPYHYGLECGSKPELMIALALHRDPEALIVCNGYKDDDFIRLALYGRRLQKRIFIVVEQLGEVRQIIQASRRMGVRPLIGLRVKLATMGEGKWASSSGENAKFGLTSPEVIDATRRLKRAGMADSVQLVHFHIGSQVPNIQTVKSATNEAARFYCELSKMGFPMRYVDVGGGLGVDYDGSRSNDESSMNYTLREYARDIVAILKSVCDDSGVAEPDIVSESGRAVVAPHSILVTEACDRISKTGVTARVPQSKRRRQSILRDLDGILENRHGSSRLERYHDAQQKRDEAYSLFNLGYMDLHERAEADSLYWRICRRLVEEDDGQTHCPEELEALPTLMADQYVCNFSVFQSLIDHWACDQLFPVAPLQRLDEKPEVEATLVDITCDSEGKISTFVDLEDVRSTLRLHELDSRPYYLGVFLVGAYQDIMGDLHNLFGRVNEVHVFLEDDEEDDFYIEDHIRGFTVSDVLGFTQYEGRMLTRRLKKEIDRATREDWIKPREGVNMLERYSELLQRHTYLET